ncbi:MAG: hypothetical protein ACJ76P_09325 [Actinomycetota bacterium]
MGSLRKVLFLHAAVWGVAGVLCAIFASTVLNWAEPNALTGWFGYVPRGATLLSGTPAGEIFVRLGGVQTFALAMFMVLVAQKIENVWWWSWAFVIGDAILAAVVLFHLAFGLENGAPTLAWWVILVLCLGFAVALVWGLFQAQQDQPIIDA